MERALTEQILAHGLLRRRKFHADGVDPLRLVGTWHRMARTAEDRLLPVQWLVVDVLGHHHMSHQAGDGRSLLADVPWHRRLDDGQFTLNLVGQRFSSMRRLGANGEGLVSSCTGTNAARA